MREYVWGDEAKFKGDSQAAGEALEAICTAHGGDLRPADVVEAARAEDSPLHDCFTWDDADYDGRFQARRLIRAIRVITIVED